MTELPTSAQETSTGTYDARGRHKAQQSNPSSYQAHVPPPKSKRRPLNHTRSLSHTKLATKSTEPRPNLLRSKSSDTIRLRAGVKRNGRSFTKLSGLQPLTKTTSNQSLKKGNSSGSLRNLGGLEKLSGIKPTGKKGKVILSLNNDDYDDNYEDIGDEKDEYPYRDDISENDNKTSNMQHSSNSSIHQSIEESKESYKESNEALNERQRPLNSNVSKLQISPEKINSNNSQEFNSMEKQKQAKKSVTNLQSNGNSPSNLYSGSLLLSQSTGLTRKIENNIQSKMMPQDSFASEAISGITFSVNPRDNNQTVEEPSNAQKRVESTNSYQPSQTILNNLQRNTSSTSTSTSSTRPSIIPQGTQQHHNGPNGYNYTQEDLNGSATFHNFLKSNSSSVSSSHQDNRTQQRLWLQRENSLMDVTSGLENGGNMVANFSGLSLNNLAGDGNLDLQPSSIQSLPLNRSESSSLLGASSIMNISGFLQNSSIQSRTEFERLNREYLNVRRHLNPVGESLNRTRTYLKNGTIKVSKRDEQQVNNFKEFSPSYSEKEQEISALVGRLWQKALSSASAQNLPPNIRGTQPVRPQNSRLQSYTQLNNMRSPQTPTTRAVKLAQQSSLRKNEQTSLNIV